MKTKTVVVQDEGVCEALDYVINIYSGVSHYTCGLEESVCPSDKWCPLTKVAKTTRKTQGVPA